MEKQRKFLLMIPLLVIPFLTMAFWALGGGKGSDTALHQNKGLDTDLPEAQFRDKEKSDKMAVYQAAQRDSIQNGISPEFLRSVGLDKSAGTVTDTAASADAQAEQIQEKLARLNKQINEPGPVHREPAVAEPEPSQVRRLNRMMQRANGESSSGDPELRQLDKMLDKIQAIQNPAAAVKQETKSAQTAKPFRAIPAMIDGKQKVADGAAVKLKLTDTATIKGQFLNKGQQLFGVCQVTNQRLLLVIKNIRLDKQIIPVQLTVFSEDGMPGIPAPEAEISGITAGNADQTLQSMQLMSMDQSLGAQAAAGGINAAKDLFSKKVKKIRVKLSDEYPLLLKINK